jgi:hypothetical protein
MNEHSHEWTPWCWHSWYEFEKLNFKEIIILNCQNIESILNDTSILYYII